jgi:hypothetical protein
VLLGIAGHGVRCSWLDLHNCYCNCVKRCCRDDGIFAASCSDFHWKYFLFENWMYFWCNAAMSWEMAVAKSGWQKVLLHTFSGYVGRCFGAMLPCHGYLWPSQVGQRRFTVCMVYREDFSFEVGYRQSDLCPGIQGGGLCSGTGSRRDAWKHLCSL